MMVWLPVLLGVILSVFPGPIEAESDMPKLADWKLCADEECSHPISMAVALQDYMAPDCRFLNIYRGQVVSVTRSYYRGAAGALLVYDITSRETYNSLAAWLTDARTLASPNIVVILCGNKKDLELELEVTFLEASRFAQENELMFLETSALTGENVEEAFLKCARTILNKIDSGELDPERMGSGIQYGHVSLRQLRQPRSAQAVAPQPCGC
ncbi:Ras-related protein Rab-4B [Cricetulus griseus]|uniref:Ras-related protein Rab-4B n=1 Tax=Cricetulus griseus TaxID=10029 RepID=G3HNR4_CRIGR|nr:Ras-related protein Rab-4B [Cricetulus griseus]